MEQQNSNLEPAYREFAVGELSSSANLSIAELRGILLASQPASLAVNLYSAELWVLFVGHETIEEMLFPLI
jgi:hypothetical protein